MSIRQLLLIFFFSSRRRHTRLSGDWSSDVCSSDLTVLDGCVILHSEIADECIIGPYAHLRPGSRLKRKAKVGNFVEVKKSVIGEGSKIPHLTYVGDATLGNHVNVGAGTITCNYDGFAKHQTIIEDDVFIGSNASQIAPVRIGRGAIVAAGSTITQE